MKNTLMQSAVYTFPANTLADQKDTLKGRSGVYGFINVTNGNYYIGSGVYLWFRLLDYQQPWYLKMKMHLPIIRAISKYGLDNFIIVILEFTTREEAVSAGQVYINKFNPAYNILQTAGNSLGYKHTDKSKAKISSTMTGSKWTDERRTEHSQRQTGSGNTFYGKNHTDEAKALLVLTHLRGQLHQSLHTWWKLVTLLLVSQLRTHHYVRPEKHWVYHILTCESLTGEIIRDITSLSIRVNRH